MPILITLLAVLALLALIIGLKWHPFIALVLVAIGAGLALGMGPAGTMTAIGNGVGGTLGGLAIILGLGAVLGGVVAETGAAKVITDKLVAGREGMSILWGLCLVGFLIGIPLFYTVAFVMMAPIIISAAEKAKLPLAMVAVATVVSLSVTHGFLPPHPAPMLISNTYGADVGKVLLYGIILGIPSRKASRIWCSSLLRIAARFTFGGGDAGARFGWRSRGGRGCVGSRKPRFLYGARSVWAID